MAIGLITGGYVLYNTTVDKKNDTIDSDDKISFKQMRSVFDKLLKCKNELIEDLNNKEKKIECDVLQKIYNDLELDYKKIV